MDDIDTGIGVSYKPGMSTPRKGETREEMNERRRRSKEQAVPDHVAEKLFRRASKETFEQTLLRRDRELADLQQVLATKAAEVADERAKVRAAMRAVGLTPEGDAASTPVVRLVTRAQAIPAEPDPEIAKLSRRELVTKALTEAFPGGATKSQLVEYIGQVRGQPENANSLSVLMTSMKNQGYLTTKNKLWYLG
jgi:hypothetical protein